MDTNKAKEIAKLVDLLDQLAEYGLRVSYIEPNEKLAPLIENPAVENRITLGYVTPL